MIRETIYNFFAYFILHIAYPFIRLLFRPDSGIYPYRSGFN